LELTLALLTDQFEILPSPASCPQARRVQSAHTNGTPYQSIPTHGVVELHGRLHPSIYFGNRSDTLVGKRKEW